MDYFTYYDKATGDYLGSHAGPDASNPYAGHDAMPGIEPSNTQLVGGVVQALPSPPDLSPLTAEELAVVLLARGAIDQAEIDAEKAKRP